MLTYRFIITLIFVYDCDVDAHVHSLECRYPVILASFVKKTLPSPVNHQDLCRKSPVSVELHLLLHLAICFPLQSWFIMPLTSLVFIFISKPVYIFVFDLKFNFLTFSKLLKPQFADILWSACPKLPTQPSYLASTPVVLLPKLQYGRWEYSVWIRR